MIEEAMRATDVAGIVQNVRQYELFQIQETVEYKQYLKNYSEYKKKIENKIKRMFTKKELEVLTKFNCIRTSDYFLIMHRDDFFNKSYSLHIKFEEPLLVLIYETSSSKIFNLKDLKIDPEEFVDVCNYKEFLSNAHKIYESTHSKILNLCVDIDDALRYYSLNKDQYKEVLRYNKSKR